MVDDSEYCYFRVREVSRPQITFLIPISNFSRLEIIEG